MFKKFSGATRVVAAVWKRMRVHAHSGWPFALLFIASSAGAIYAWHAGFPETARANTLLLSVVLLVIWEVAVLREMTGAENYAPVRTELRYATSFVLFMIILIFGGVIILLPLIMATMALWALVSFDFESAEPTQEELTASFEAFQSHPLFALCVLVFASGLAGFLAFFMRGRAYAAASVAEQRIVAMEAFNWTRTQSMFLMWVGLLTLLPFALLWSISIMLLPTAASSATGGLAIASILVAVTFWLLMLALQSVSVEIYERHRPSRA